MTRLLAIAIVAIPPVVGLLALLALERRRFDAQRDQIAEAAEARADHPLAEPYWPTSSADEPIRFAIVASA